MGTATTDAYISYTVEPIDLNTTAIESYLDQIALGYTTYPVSINASSFGNLTINQTEIYYNGTANYTVTANYYGNATYDPSSDDENLTVIFSGYNLSFAEDYIEFIPRSPTSKNVTPYGQTSTIPIINLTSFGYEMPFNLTMNSNETHACVNDTISITYNKTTGVQLNTTYQSLTTGVSVDESVSLFAWADYGCNYTTWKWWQPLWDLKTCCRDCVCQVN